MVNVSVHQAGGEVDVIYNVQLALMDQDVKGIASVPMVQAVTM